MNKLLILLDLTEKNKFYKISYFVLLPISYIIEIICFINFWYFVILKELLTNENVVKYFDENEFGYKWYKLYKKDIVEPDSFLDNLKIEEIIVQVKKEFVTTTLNIIKEATTLDIENYCNLNVKGKILPENKLKQYDVTFQYYRTYLLFDNLKYFLIYLFLLSVLLFLYSEQIINLFCLITDKIFGYI